MKKIFGLFCVLFLFLGFSFAQDYVFYYGNGCSHCAKVEKFFDETHADKRYGVEYREVYFDADNRKQFMIDAKKLGIDQNNVGVPLLFIDDNKKYRYIQGDKDIIAFFKTKISEDISQDDVSTKSGTVGLADKIYDQQEITPLSKRIAFFGVMLPAALADSINPCAFAVILILLGSILSQKKKKKTALLAGIGFALAIFMSYLLMGLGVMKAMASATNTETLKIVIGVLGILVGLANLKDFLRYDKGFKMEVPEAWRPKMKSLIKRVTSPRGAVVIGVVVSLFLLPCTSGPYLTILGYLSSQGVDALWGAIYLIVYNLIFILPMIVITLVVVNGTHTAKHLMRIKKSHDKIIHLIVGILMLGLGLYVIFLG